MRCLVICRCLAVAAVVMSAVVPSGCSHDESLGEPHDVHVDPGGDAPHLPTIPDLDDAEGAVADATFGECATTPGLHTVRGTLENSSDGDMTYVVAVSWIDADAEVVQRGVTEVSDVASGAAADFTVSADVPKGVTACTYYVLRAPAD